MEKKEESEAREKSEEVREGVLLSLCRGGDTAPSWTRIHDYLNDVSPIRMNDDSKKNDDQSESDESIACNQARSVNAKQYLRIIRRRQDRERQRQLLASNQRTLMFHPSSNPNRTFRYYSRHRLAQSRPRAKNGKFLAKHATHQSGTSSTK